MYNIITYVQDALQVVILVNEKWYEMSEIYPINQIIEEQSGQLLQIISQVYSRQLAQEDNYKFIYYNSMNFAIKKSSKIGEIDNFSLRTIRYFANAGTVKSLVRTP
jgi:hypothetical protein